MKKLYRDWRIYAALTLIALSYLVYSCSRPTEVEREREISCNTHAIFSLLSEDTRGTMSSTDSDYFTGWFRTPFGLNYPIQMVNSTAYYSDEEVGGQTHITAIYDGDTWHARVLLPDGSSSEWTDVTFHAEYEGETDCFVNWFPYWKACGTRDIYVTFLRSAVCDYPGVWQMSFYKNDSQYYEGAFTVLPRLEPGTVPSGAEYNQGSYTDDSYNSICYTAEWPDTILPCDGREGEITYTIQKMGCALISGVIILNYYGLTVTPIELNAWLDDPANNGYDEEGNIYFHRIAEYAQKVHGLNVSYFKTIREIEWDKLKTYICSFGPQVLAVKNANHFVVGTGMNDEETTYLVVDPNGGVETTLADRYNNGFNSIRHFRGPKWMAYRGNVNIRLHSPGELIIISPSGDKTGLDPISGDNPCEIPYSSYETIGLENQITGNTGPETKELEIMLPEEGDYTLQVTGTDSGTYIIEIDCSDEDFESSHFISDEIPIYNEAVHQYSIQYGPSGGDLMKIEGGYDGDSQRKWDVNQLLSYFTIASKTVRLPSGIMQYALGITYHEDIDAGSFAATLNDVDISDMFNPIPDSSEIVTINLSQGSNSLVLTIEGDVPSRRNVDTDKFEIIATP